MLAQIETESLLKVQPFFFLKQKSDQRKLFLFLEKWGVLKKLVVKSWIGFLKMLLTKRNS